MLTNAGGPGILAADALEARGMEVAQAMLDSYAALVSGVLIGMSEGLQSSGATAPAEAKPKKK